RPSPSPEAAVSFLPMEALGERGEIDLSSTRPLDDVKGGFTRFYEGDGIVAKITPCFENGKGAVWSGTLEGIGFGTTELHVLRPSSEIDARYLYYVTMSSPVRQGGEAAMYGAAGQKRVPESFVRDFRAYAPSFDAQVRAVEYLDRETNRIDELIAAKQRLIDGLSEKRRAVIAQAVTRGIDPGVPMRDSGIEWLGSVPAHWDVVRLRYMAQDIQTGPFGSQLHADEYVPDGVIPVVNPSHLVGGVISPEEGVSVDEVTAERLSRHRLRLGDLVFGRRGELGRCAVVDAAQAGWLCGTGCLRVRLNLGRDDPHYINLLFANTAASDELLLESVGSTMDNLNTAILGSCAVPRPPLHEQQAAVASVRNSTSSLRALEEATVRSIELLIERRAALITS